MPATCRVPSCFVLHPPFPNPESLFPASSGLANSSLRLQGSAEMSLLREAFPDPSLPDHQGLALGPCYASLTSLLFILQI